MSKEWEGDERRKNAQLSEQRLQVLERSFGIFGERLSNLIESTKEYHTISSKNIDDILRRVSNLPCDKRSGWYDSLNTQIKAVWVILISLTVWLFKEIIR